MSRQLYLIFILNLPLLYLLNMLFIREVEDPIKYIYSVTGATALTLLYVTISISMIIKSVNLIKYRRIIGLYSFFYAFLHMLNFIILDMELDLELATKEVLEKQFIYLGSIVFVILLFMSITSIKMLFLRYYKYHKVIYIAILFASIHFIMAQKVLSIDQWIYLIVMGVIIVFKFLQKIKY